MAHTIIFGASPLATIFKVQDYWSCPSAHHVYVPLWQDPPTCPCVTHPLHPSLHHTAIALLSSAYLLCWATTPLPHSYLSINLNCLHFSLPAIYSHHNSLSAQPKEPKSCYVSSMDIHDDDLEDNEPLAELNESLLPCPSALKLHTLSSTYTYNWSCFFCHPDVQLRILHTLPEVKNFHLPVIQPIQFKAAITAAEECSAPLTLLPNLHHALWQ